jgi:hypothetical protein
MDDNQWPADDYDDSAVNFNITKASKTWSCQDTADSHVMAQFYLAIVQSRLLYGSERPTWVLSQHTLT